MDFTPAGTVYGVLLNFRAERAAWAAQMQQVPYQAPPQAPVLYVKTANTWTPHGQPIPMPRHLSQVEIGATVTMVMGSDCFRIAAASALQAVSGYVLMNDLSVPHPSYFRPPVRFKCLDGFLGIGDTMLDASALGDPARLRLRVAINGMAVQQVDFAGLVRDAGRLIADVSAFMTLRRGDMLMLGCDCLADGSRPQARVGDRIEIHADGLGTLGNQLVADA